MLEIVFVAAPDEDGGYTAAAKGASIFTQGESWEELEANARDAVRCHFDDAERPTTIHLRLAKESVIEV